VTATPTAISGAGTTPPTTPPTPSATPVLVGGVPVDDLCAFLAADVPRLQEQDVGAVARLARDLTDFYAVQFLPRPDGAVIDAAITRACPAVRNAVLLVIRQPDLRAL
jgi:hypothetical protein